MQMTQNFSSPSIHQISTATPVTYKMLYNRSLLWMTANLLTLNSSKTEFLLTGLKQQLRKIQDCSLTITHSARNLGFVYTTLLYYYYYYYLVLYSTNTEHLTFSDQITALFKSCYYHIRQLHCIRLYFDFKTTANTIATSVHSKLDYCNSLCHNFPNSQLKKHRRRHRKGVRRRGLTGAFPKLKKKIFAHSNTEHFMLCSLYKEVSFTIIL